MGVATGCGCDFLILLIPTPLVYVRFYNSIPTFVHFLMFFVLYIYIVGHFHFVQRCLIENYYTFICSWRNVCG